MRPAKYDLTGQTFGHLTVEKQVEPPFGCQPMATYWLCRCEKCKTGTETLTSSDLTGHRRSQCARCTEMVHDLTGKEYGVWKVLRRAEDSEIPDCKTGKKQSWWRVQCTLCGKEAVRGRGTLKRLQAQCGCIERKPVSSPRLFVKVDGINHQLNLKTKTKQCAWCGKVFELECVGQWGWNIGNDLFCTYRCMRKEEEARKTHKKRGARLA